MEPSEVDITVATNEGLVPASDLAIEELEERVVPGVHGACACSTSCSCTSSSCVIWF
jgi:hypothetical protein